MRDRTELPSQQKNTHVKAYALFNNENDYALLGEGSLQIVTDADMLQSQHYIQVTNQENQDIFMRSRLVNTNVYERQKSTVILWNDPEQTLSNYLAVSFETPEICDRFWQLMGLFRRLICSKIGKNYLEINGREKLDMPTFKNIVSFQQKIKTSYNLIAYHVINSADFMTALWSSLQSLKDRNQKVTGIQILRDLLSNFDPKIMQIFLSDPNFEHFLSFYQGKNQNNADECKINFKEYYEKSSKIHKLIDLSEIAKTRIQLALRAKFVKQCVIDYAKDAMIQNMLSQVIKQNQIETLINVLQQNSFPRIIQVYGQAKKQQNEQKRIIHRKIITFLLECVWILRINHADNTKMIFLNAFYSSGMLKIMGEFLGEGKHKALEVLSCLAVLDPNLFMNQLMNDYRNNSSINLIRIVCKQFSQNRPEFVDETVNFFKSLKEYLIQDRKTFEFLNKTLILSIFMICKHYSRILQLAEVCIYELNGLKQIFEHITKFSVFKNLTQKIKKKETSKNQIVQIVKILKIVVESNNPQYPNPLSTEQMGKINGQFIDSGLFEQILVYFNQNISLKNLIISSILQILSTISFLKYNLFTEAVQKFNFNSIKTGAQQTSLNKYLQLIHNIRDQKKQQLLNFDEADIIRKRAHRQLLQSQKQQQYLQEQIQQQSQMQKHEQKTVQMVTPGDDIQANLNQIKQEIKQSENQNQNQWISRKKQSKQKAEMKFDIDFGDIGDS